jgi:class 3 adenylate cyclase/tetratricopeptide (TPR) repeat protein
MMPLELVEQSVSAAPLALVFTDMVGSSAAKRDASLGDNPTIRDSNYLDAVQTRHLRLVRECVAAHGGKEIMTIGDAFFLTFDDARAALLCSAEIQMRLRAQPIMTSNGPLQLRIGMHVGRPKFFENSWHGTDVDTAARAESAGSPEQIIVTETARFYLGEMAGVQLRPLGTFALKGVGDVKLYDADYDHHGPRKPQLPSVELQRRQTRVKLLWRAGYAALVLLIALGGLYYYRHHHNTTFTERDKVILADFDNKTGDPVFDATLKEALSIQLEQSPYLQLVSDQELHADLRYLNQPTEQRITPELARELGQREGIKAYISASVANIGTSYVVSINAINTATGDAIARAQAESPDKNHVLTAVATAATSIRTKLGESIASVQKLTTPFMDVTTSSLEAFHAYSLGESDHQKAADPEAMTYYKQAIELDPNFAMAYARLGVVYGNFGQLGKARENLAKAYDLREHATERERLYITAQYASTKGDIPGTIEGYQALLTAYPNDPAALNNIGIIYTNAGDSLKSVHYYQQVADTEPWDISSDDNVAGTLLCLDRPQDAKKYIAFSTSVNTGVDTPLIVNQALYALETGSAPWKSYAGSADSRPDGYLLSQTYSDIDEMQGSLVEARTFADQGARSALQAKAPDAAGNVLSTAAAMEAELGECSAAPAIAKRALTLDASIQTLPAASYALAACGQGATILAALRKLAHDFPDNTLANDVYLPQTQAAMALFGHRPQDVLTLLEPARPYAMASFVPILEGEAYLELHRPSDALDALKPATDYRYLEAQNGFNGEIPSYSMALLLSARAQVMLGDKASATKNYQRVIDLWKNADPGFKPLADAKKELAALN